MSGRAEQDFKREQWIENKLNEYAKEPLLRDYMISCRKKTPATKKAYLRYITEYIDYMNDNGIPITEVKPRHISRYVNFVSQSGEKIVNTKISAITNFYKFLQENEFISKNPCSSDLRINFDEEENVIFMTDSEVEQIKRNALNRKFKYKNRDLCIITLGCATGLRVSAIVNIDIEDIDFDNRTITVIEKGNKKRDIDFGINTLRIIKRWMQDRQSIVGNNEGPLFISQKKNRMSVRAVQEMIHKSSIGIDKHITPHKMRSTYATKLYNKTGDIYLTSKQLGHKSIETTQRYAKTYDYKKKEAAILMD